MVVVAAAGQVLSSAAMDSDRDQSPPEGPVSPAMSRAEARAQRRARRQRLRPILDSSVPSPCIAVCQIDQVRGHCLGCYRTLDEIRDWPILPREEKLTVLEACETRRTGKRG